MTLVKHCHCSTLTHLKEFFGIFGRWCKQEAVFIFAHVPKLVHLLIGFLHVFGEVNIAIVCGYERNVPPKTRVRPVSVANAASKSSRSSARI